MKIPDQIRVRLIFTYNGKEFIKFYWFQMKDDDFYWGSSYKSNRSEDTITEINGTQVTIEVPENFDSLPKLSGKYSYHQSGKIHYKMNLKDGESSYIENSKWILKEEIQKPVRFFTVISKGIKFYKKRTTNPTKGNSSALVLKLEKHDENQRHYFEFFLSPEGKFEIPEALLKVDKPINNIITHSISPNLILVIRHAVMGSFYDWHLDKEIVFIPNELQ